MKNINLSEPLPLKVRECTLRRMNSSDLCCALHIPIFIWEPHVQVALSQRVNSSDYYRFSAHRFYKNRQDGRTDGRTDGQTVDLERLTGRRDTRSTRVVTKAQHSQYITIAKKNRLTMIVETN